MRKQTNERSQQWAGKTGKAPIPNLCPRSPDDAHHWVLDMDGHGKCKYCEVT